MPSTTQTEAPPGFRSRSFTWQLGEDVSISRMVQTPHEVELPNDETFEMQREVVFLVFVRSGSWQLSDLRHDFAFGSSDAGYVVSGSRVVGRNVETSAITTVQVPRESLNDLGAPTPTTLGAFQRAPLVDATLSFVLGLTAESPGAAAVAEPASALVSQLVTGLFLEERRYRMDSQGLASGLWARAQTIIGAQSADPGLTPQSVAAQLNVSVRHLQRAFSLTGDTPAEAIRRARLERAVRDIQNSARTFSEVAGRSGFANLAEMRRALQTVHATNPSDMRAMAQQG